MSTATLIFVPESQRNNSAISPSVATIYLPITPNKLYHVFEGQVRSQHPERWSTIKNPYGYSFKYPKNGTLEYVDDETNTTEILPVPPRSREGIIYVLTKELQAGGKSKRKRCKKRKTRKSRKRKSRFNIF